MFESAGCSGCFEGCRLLLKLGRPSWRPRDEKITILDKENMIFVSVVKLYNFW
jgi:hypothetical protein